MSAPVKHPAPLDRARSTDELSHYCCCRDHDVTLCGLHDDSEMVPFDGSGVDCVVCTSLEENPDYCPLYTRCEPPR